MIHRTIMNHPVQRDSAAIWGPTWSNMRMFQSLKLGQSLAVAHLAKTLLDFAERVFRHEIAVLKQGPSAERTLSRAPK